MYHHCYSIWMPWFFSKDTQTYCSKKGAGTSLTVKTVSYDHLIFIMKILIPGKMVFHWKQGPESYQRASLITRWSLSLGSDLHIICHLHVLPAGTTIQFACSMNGSRQPAKILAIWRINRLPATGADKRLTTDGLETPHLRVWNKAQQRSCIDGDGTASVSVVQWYWAHRALGIVDWPAPSEMVFIPVIWCIYCSCMGQTILQLHGADNTAAAWGRQYCSYMGLTILQLNGADNTTATWDRQCCNCMGQTIVQLRGANYCSCMGQTIVQLHGTDNTASTRGI